MLRYFGYGSNMNLDSLRAKGVSPLASHRATLAGWRLRFNVHHWFRHEGGVGNISPGEGESCRVLGVVHELEDDALAKLDAVESYGVGYDRIEVEVETEGGSMLATTYVGVPSYLDDSCLPTRRYLNIVVRGAEAAGLDADYIRALRERPVHAPEDYPPFEHPIEGAPVFDARSLSDHPTYTAIGGAVFDMSEARWQHQHLVELFGGKDMTLFHVRRHDESRGDETLEDLREGRLGEGQRRYINAYVHEHAREYRYVGRFVYG